jgi:hypothetical protein
MLDCDRQALGSDLVIRPVHAKATDDLGTAKRMPFHMRVGKVPGNIVRMFAPSIQYTA